MNLKTQIDRTYTSSNKLKTILANTNKSLEKIGTKAANFNEVPNKLQIAINSSVKFAELNVNNTVVYKTYGGTPLNKIVYPNTLSFKPKRIILLHSLKSEYWTGTRYFGVDSSCQQGAPFSSIKHLYLRIKNFNENYVEFSPIMMNQYSNFEATVYKIIAIG